MDQSSGSRAAPSLALPVIERQRHELRRRELEVVAIEALAPRMLRLTLAGEDLDDFVSAAPDDHVKIFIPGDDGETVMRDYTPRRFDRAARTLAIDFALHEAGPATRWAMDARLGARLTIGGPRGSAVISGVRRWLLVADETGLPALGRRIEEAPADHAFIAIAAVTGAEEQQALDSAAQLRMIWVHRPESAATEAGPLLAALADVALAPETFAWIAAEGSVARALRRHLVERGHPLPWIKAAGYWTAGKADAHETITD